MTYSNLSHLPPVDKRVPPPSCPAYANQTFATWSPAPSPNVAIIVFPTSCGSPAVAVFTEQQKLGHPHAPDPQLTADVTVEKVSYQRVSGALLLAARLFEGALDLFETI